MGRSYVRRSSPMRASGAPDDPQTRRFRALGIALCALVGAVVSPLSAAHAGVITSKSFFDALPTTTIDFETDGLGNAISLIDGQTMTMPTSAYQNLGVVFQSAVSWVNDGTIDFDIAQFLGGSPNNAIPSSSINGMTIMFTVPVRSVGMFIANNHIIDSDGPTFTARDEFGNILETVAFGSQASESSFVEGRVGIADYGFMGLTSTTLIASLTISKEAAILDDLMFSSEIPSPGAAIPFALLAAYAARRRR